MFYTCSYDMNESIHKWTVISWPLQHPARRVFVHPPRMSDVAAKGKRSQMLSGPGSIQLQPLCTGLPKSDCTWLWHPGIPSNFGGAGTSPSFATKISGTSKEECWKQQLANPWFVHCLELMEYTSHVSVLPNSPWQALPALLQLGHHHHLQCDFWKGRCDVALRATERYWKVPKNRQCQLSYQCQFL